ncbi:MAG: 4-hydroxy-3-methylbut-2-enyl diphosphate reductase [Prosthecobacter sp.]|jgi:4-hydroxy-3-methylbut-2-enyl diphosphate reductase|uniref:4-hydroxy-3-methylbut-2-enyl diphosphate reductase n=1 Tax=Prosthecobacter sp. TaxID=1965333 RepID=UPI0019F4083B|nr:4-hydroxy-3-methylbut-2-enyl diphosphate reductase [Prosthecobacter sp.]MBE2282109.1 4-hydroxy-3-methylbut-2-enyl diphosphate reductase [Prosthecobacter sp.]
MNIHLAQHHGMCFGVRDALRATHAAAQRAPLTILGQLVHNPVVDRHLAAVGARKGDLDDLNSATTVQVAITAHGASDQNRRAWQTAGHNVIDTTCPLVRKAHHALATLVSDGYQPVVIGQRQHVEVRGLIGDFPQAVVVLDEGDLDQIPVHPHLGIVSQTTQPIEVALRLVEAIKRLHRGSEVRFIDTICHPTKQRQTAMDDLIRTCDHIVVIGGRNSNNTRQLAQKAAANGLRTLQIESADELDPAWFTEARNVGVTAGTSTLDETVDAVMQRLRQIAAELRTTPAHEFLRTMLQAA